MNNSLTGIPSTQAYFSHSYRKEDRDVNLFFWKLFHSNGFFFAIDPQSDDNTFNITYLERLMRSSDCFIAVVTRRKKPSTDVRVSSYTHSPYIAFENFLAELAEKPRLVFVESGLDKSVLDPLIAVAYTLLNVIFWKSRKTNSTKLCRISLR